VTGQQRERLEWLLRSAEHAHGVVRDMQVASNRWEDATIEQVKGSLWWIIRCAQRLLEEPAAESSLDELARVTAEGFKAVNEIAGALSQRLELLEARGQGLAWWEE
jgi:hypothetical protein